MRTKPQLRCIVATALAILLCLSAISRADGPGAKPSTQLGLIHYLPPAGWALSEQTGKLAQLWACPNTPTDEPIAILVLLTEASGGSLDFQGRFANAVQRAAGNQKLLTNSPLIAGRTGQGFDTLSQEFSFVNASGQTIRGKFVAARIVNRLAAFCYYATGDTQYQSHLSDMDNVVSSAGFDLPATMASVQPATNPTAVVGAAIPTAPIAGALLVRDGGIDKTSLVGHFPPRTKITLTLAPAAGNPAAETRTLSCDVAGLKNTAHFDWLPPAVYHVTARAMLPDAREWPLKLSDKPSPSSADWKDAVDADLRTSPTLHVMDIPR